MARTVHFDLDAILTSAIRKPAYEILVYDLRSTTHTIGDVVRQRTSTSPPPLDPLIGPRDFAEDVEQLTINEQAGDFVGNGIAFSSIGFVVRDPDNRFDPILAIAEPTGDGRWLRRGNVVVVREGDARIAREHWLTTFTGKLVGQAGVVRTRDTGSGPESALSLVAHDRTPAFLKRNTTSQEFGLGTAYLTAATTLATDDMALDSEEIDFSSWGAQVTGQVTTTFTEQPALIGIAQLMFCDGRMPRFNGLGQLSDTSGVISKGPSRIYTDLRTIKGIERPASDLDAVDAVIVKGLSSVQTKITQPFQELARLEITTGFFTRKEEIDVRLSEDLTLLADNVVMQTKVSAATGGINFLGGEEVFVPTYAPGGIGIIGGELQIETGYAPQVVLTMFAIYVVLAAIPNIVVTAGFIVGGGYTINIGGIAQSLFLIAITLIMTRIGRGSYRFYGNPIEWVFEEISGEARTSGVPSWELQEIEIVNHLVQTQANADSAARDVLFRLRARANPRVVSTLGDLRLEPDDVFQTPNGRRYMVDAMTRVLRRDQAATAQTWQCFEVTTEVLE